MDYFHLYAFPAKTKLLLANRAGVREEGKMLMQIFNLLI